jgi:hypothetical protein
MNLISHMSRQQSLLRWRDLRGRKLHGKYTTFVLDLRKILSEVLLFAFESS